MRLLGLELLIADVALRQTGNLVDVYFHTISALGFALILASTVWAVPNSSWARALTHPSLAFLGMISYSLYLWHEPVMIFLSDHHLADFQSPAWFPFSLALLMALSIALATLSYWSIEYPTRLLRYAFTGDGHLARRYSR
jgi:peptidoglycan/LPS O-acetylase OafA/YrhL